MVRGKKVEKYRNEVRKVNTGMNRKRSKIQQVSDERNKYKQALEDVAYKNPHRVCRAEAADMACEFYYIAKKALDQK